MQIDDFDKNLIEKGILRQEDCVRKHSPNKVSG
jgi:hypothetical protein